MVPKYTSKFGSLSILHARKTDFSFLLSSKIFLEIIKKATKKKNNYVNNC